MTLSICLLGAGGGVVDLSTPEATLRTYYGGYMRGNAQMVRQALHDSLRLDDDENISSRIVRGYRILEIREITKPRLFGRPGDVEVTTEVYWRTGHPPSTVWFLLRPLKNGWRIVEYSAHNSEE